MTDARIERAVRLKKDLTNLVPEMRSEFDRSTCIETVAMLQSLGTEVTRLRLAIGTFLYGRMDRHELRKISETWNDGGAAT